MYLCRELLGITHQNIAAILGKKDHTTIMHGVKSIEDKLQNDVDLNNKIDTIKKKISPN